MSIVQDTMALIDELVQDLRKMISADNYVAANALALLCAIQNIVPICQRHRHGVRQGPQ